MELIFSANQSIYKTMPVLSLSIMLGKAQSKHKQGFWPPKQG